MKNKIVLTGGGSAGHVTVNLALIPMLVESGWEVVYAGSKNGIERQLLSNLEVKYYGISTGKLRRYFAWRNFTDIFRVLKGIVEASKIIRQEQPKIVFSKGGFVSVPVAIASRLNDIPVITHESDLTPGLANRINIHFSQKICTTFPDTLKRLPENKGEYIGAIVRSQLKRGVAERGRIFCNFESKKPVVLVTGGSLGSVSINQTVRSILQYLLPQFHVVHLCGRGNLEPHLEQKGYQQFEYIDRELADLMCLADLVISRAGSNSIFEFLALRKPMILIPLSRKSSRGDQIENAKVFKRQGFAEVILEQELTENKLLETIQSVFSNRHEYQNRMANWNSDCSLHKLFDLITNYT